MLHEHLVFLCTFLPLTWCSTLLCDRHFEIIIQTHTVQNGRSFCCYSLCPWLRVHWAIVSDTSKNRSAGMIPCSRLGLLNNITSVIKPLMESHHDSTRDCSSTRLNTHAVSSDSLRNWKH